MKKFTYLILSLVLAALVIVSPDQPGLSDDLTIVLQALLSGFFFGLWVIAD